MPSGVVATIREYAAAVMKRVVAVAGFRGSSGAHIAVGHTGFPSNPRGGRLW